MSTVTAPSIRVGSAVLVTDEGRVLLGKRGKQPHYGCWVLPGGGVETFERIDDAAVREVTEETGLQVEVVRRLGVFEVVSPPTEHRLIIFSEARIVGGILSPASDLLDAKFFSRAQLLNLDVTPLVREVLTTAGWLSLAAA